MFMTRAKASFAGAIRYERFVKVHPLGRDEMTRMNATEATPRLS